MPVTAECHLLGLPFTTMMQVIKVAIYFIFYFLSREREAIRRVKRACDFRACASACLPQCAHYIHRMSSNC